MLEYADWCWTGRVLEADSRAAQTTEPAFRVSRISKVWTCSIQGIVSYRGGSSPLNVQGKAGSYFDMSRQHCHRTERAHAVRDPNGRAYNRTAHLVERRAMTQQWSDWLMELKTGAIAALPCK